MANKSLFTVQYSTALDKFFLTEKENPENGVPFDIPVIDCENNSIIKLGSIMVDKDKIECSKPGQLTFSNPFNVPPPVYKFGLLYNAYATKHVNFCPEGWHLPTQDEWDTIYSSVENDAGSLKDTSIDFWNSPNTGANNSSGFNARGGGYRQREYRFYNFKSNAYFWTSTEYADGWSYAKQINYNDVVMSNRHATNDYAYSVRLVKKTISH